MRRSYMLMMSSQWKSTEKIVVPTGGPYKIKKMSLIS